MTTIAQAFDQIIALQNECDKAFSVFNEILEKHKESAKLLRNQIRPADLIGKPYFMNRPFKWGNLKSIPNQVLESKDRHFFQEENGAIKILPYYKHLEAYDNEGIENFITQFQDFSILQKTNTEFFKEDSNFLVLWAEDLDFETDEPSFFNSPQLMYEYVIFRI